MPSKKDLKGIKKQKRKNTPVVSKMADILYGKGDAFTKISMYVGDNTYWDRSNNCPNVDFLEIDEMIYTDKLLDCMTLLQSWIQIIVSNNLCMLSDHQRMIIEEVILKSTPALHVAKKLNKTKTVVSHSLYGIFVPEYNTFHGGSLKKLRTIIEKSPEYKNYTKLRKILSSKPSEAFLDTFLDYAKDRRFSYILSEKLLAINPYIEESNYVNTKNSKKVSRLQS